MKAQQLIGLLCLTLVTFLLGCDDMYEVDITTYVIEKGEHKSSVQGGIGGFRTLKSESLRFTASFDESARYDLRSKNQADVNKLFGFSDCNSLHHTNSARFGWNYNLATQQVDIYAYVYQNKTRIMEKLGAINIGETATFSITLLGEGYEFNFKGESTRINRGTDCEKGLYYLLYPYFGGNEPAPHQVRVYIKEYIG